VQSEPGRGPIGWFRRLFGMDRTIIPIVRLHGVIAADPRPGRLNIASVAPMLERAFTIKGAPVVAVVVNSPGGSPVQSRLISKRIRDLADEHGKRVIVFVEDAAASGGYFIAVAGDEIIADPSSIVGSIGVIISGFGFVEAIEKLGVTRRVHTAGKNKSTLDPFLPERAEDIERIKKSELEIHQVFIDHVKARRGGRLNGPDDELFTGEWWTGVRGLQLGLVDSLGDLHQVLRERYGKETRFKLIAPKRGLFTLPRFGFSALGWQDAISEGMSRIEDRVHWLRLGL
jgi:signal peptide peptidase SppA